jgi:CubicO group peptidase (beta-lactamase class C family)
LFIRALLVCCLGLSLTACGSLTVTEVDPATATQLHADHAVPLDIEAERLVEPMVTSGYTPGIVAGVLLPDGSMHFYAYGVADQTSGAPLDADTLFPVGSLSKGFLAAMTSMTVEEHKLSWQDKLPKLLPPGTELSPDAQNVTLLQMATHTAGFPRQPIEKQTLAYFIEYLFDGENFYRHIDSDYILNYLTDYESDGAGTIRYSNIGYGLLSTALQRQSGKSIDALLKQRITGPLRLTCTGYDPVTLPCSAHRAYGYVGDSPWFMARGEPTPDWEFSHFMRGAAGLHSTARDILTFAAAHLHGHKKLNKTLASDLRQRVSEPDSGVGIGWTIENVDGQPIEYEIGLVAGYTSYLGLDPAHKTAVVLMQNSFNWDSSTGHKLLVYLRNADILHPAKK